MPLVQIHLYRNVWSPDQIRSIANTIQAVMESHFNAPARDRYQHIFQHESYEMICEDTNLGLQRTEKLIFLHIFQQGRSAEVKQRTYAELKKRLGEEFSVGDADLIISCSENTKEDWSFGAGKAQFLTGDL